MKLTSRRMLVRMIFGAWIATLPGLCSLANAQTTAVPTSAETWVRENYNSALDLLLKDRGCPVGQKSRIRWITCVRIVPGHQTEPESELSLEEHYDGTVLAKIMRPIAQSIYVQLGQLKRQHPDASLRDIARWIPVETRSADQKRFPQLQQFADGFGQIRIAPVLSDELIMDATKYELRAKSFSGEYIRLLLLGPGSSSVNQPCPLLQWIEALRQALATLYPD